MFQLRVIAALTLVMALLPVGARSQQSETSSSILSGFSHLSGHWTHDPGRSDQHFIGPEYPGRWMVVEASSTRLDVEQSLGGVRNGVPTPGSGSETAQWSLATDGSEQQITTGRLVRDMSASWHGDELHLRYELPLAGDEAMAGHEVWRLVEDGNVLEVVRTIRFDGRAKTRSLFFRRDEQ